MECACEREGSSAEKHSWAFRAWPNVSYVFLPVGHTHSHTLIDPYDFLVFDFFFVPDVSILSTSFMILFGILLISAYTWRDSVIWHKRTQNNRKSNEQISSSMRWKRFDRADVANDIVEYTVPSHKFLQWEKQKNENHSNSCLFSNDSIYVGDIFFSSHISWGFNVRRDRSTLLRRLTRQNVADITLWQWVKNLSFFHWKDIGAPSLCRPMFARTHLTKTISMNIKFILI